MNFLTKFACLAAFGAVLYATNVCQGWTLSFVLFVAWIMTGGYYTIYLLYHTFWRDIKALNFMIQLLMLVKKGEFQNMSVPKMFSKTAKKMPNKVMFYFEDQTWTFKQIDEYSNKVANYFSSLNYSKNDTIALFMENRPEYVATWLGLAKIGVIPALINYNLKQNALVHTVRVANSKAIIYGVELSQEVSEILSTLKNGTSVAFPNFSSGPVEKKNFDVPNTVDLNEILDSVSASPVPMEIQNEIGFNDKLLYIYTSGTTGLPKAAVIKHSRFLMAGLVPVFLGGLEPSDILYNALPLYHSSAGMLALGPSFRYGISVTLRVKFSASNFWKDCVKYNCTVRYC